MKFNKVLTVFVSLAVFSLLMYTYDSFSYRNSYNFNVMEKEKNDSEQNVSNNNINIYIYDNKKNSYFIEQVSVKSNIIDEGNYVNAVINHFFTNEDNLYKFLASYTLKENNNKLIIIKLNSKFSKVNKTNMQSIANSITKTLKSNFDIDTVKIEIDSN